MCYKSQVLSNPLKWMTLPLLVGAALGCASLPFMQPPERTSIVTPNMRVSAIREIGARARDAEAAEQQQLADQLAAQIQTEADPLVRKAIQETIAEFPVPLARQVLIAGLSDSEMEVRIACCKNLGSRGEPEAIQALQKVVASDDHLDVRLAAVDALGGIESPESVAALAIAVKDRDPAMQYAGVEALQAVSGEDFGNDVEAWRQYASSQQAPGNISVAEQSSESSTY